MFNSHVLVVELVDFCFTEINQVCGQRIAEHLVVNVDRSLRDCEEGALADVVLEPEVVIVEDALGFERVLFWKQVTSEGFVLATLWRVHHLRDQHASFRHVRAQLTGQLVFVDESQLDACGVKQDLMYHVVGALGVLDHAVKEDEPRGHHDREHDWVGPVEWILLDQVSKNRQRHCEPHEQERHCVPLNKSQPDVMLTC